MLSYLVKNDWGLGVVDWGIYGDNLFIFSYSEVRKVIEEAFAETIKSNFQECQAVFVTSTAGIAHAAYVSDILHLPMGYVCIKNKDLSYGFSDRRCGKSVGSSR